MRLAIRTAFVTAAAAASALGLGVASANAAGWTATPTGAFTASSSNVSMADGSISAKCSSTASGTLQDSSNIGTISSISFPQSSCSSAVGSPTVTATTPWQLEAVSYDSSSGVTTGYIDDIKASVSLLGCNFTVSGSAGATYTNGSGTLAVATDSSHGLKVTSASGLLCTGLISVGDSVSFTADYAVSTSGGAPVISES